MAVSPMTYHGYDKDGKCVSSATASNATDYIDPAEIAKAVDNVQNVAADETDNIANAMSQLTDDANDAIIVQGTKMTATFEEVITGIKTIPGQIGDSLSEIKSIAQQKHDELQNEFNDAARNACYCNGAVSVS